jgi:mannose-6-phosphate isomerase-like protein (cupin superfamily)
MAVVPAGQAHAFVNSGLGRLRQIDIHLSPKFITDWLD